MEKMDKVDVFVWMDGEDGVVSAMAARSLRHKMKAEVGEWFVLAPRSDKSDHLAYDVGAKLVVRPEKLSSLGAIAATHGSSPLVLLWSGAAVLTSDWQPMQNGHLRLWESCPAALVLRTDLPAEGAESWPELQARTSLLRTALPPNQVKVVGPGDFDKAVHSQGWPFGHNVVILEKPIPRR